MNKVFQNIISTVLLLFLYLSAFSQNETAIIYGKLKDVRNRKVSGANVYIMQTGRGTTTDNDGKFRMELPANKTLTLKFSFIGYATSVTKVKYLPNAETQLFITLFDSLEMIDDIIVRDKSNRTTTMGRLDPKTFEVVPASGGDGLVAVIKTQAGVSSNNELSSQYNVRGGNFDENLVYVNDIEIYRPFLVRSGRQEGLGFVNSDLISSIAFSAGGFDAKYGDKLSSVLDIKYKAPKKFGGSLSGSLLGASGHLEGISKNKKFTFLIGSRYHTTKYMLNSLETDGDYNPTFVDVQSYLTYKMTDNLKISFLGNIAMNKYELVPSDRSTDYGTYNIAYNLDIQYRGQEIDQYLTYMGALSADYSSNPNLRLKFIASAYSTQEKETYDIHSKYLLNELDQNPGSKSYGDSTMNLGYGETIDHARNYLNAQVFSFAHKGFYSSGNNDLQWGVKLKYEFIDDNVLEWQLLDSASYSIPYLGSYLVMNEYLAAKHKFEWARFSAYLQDNYRFYIGKSEFEITAGLRSNFWSFNNQLLLSPRGTISFFPKWLRKDKKEHDILFRFSFGLYQQAPSYREMRDFDGVINKNIKAQKSIHFVLGSDFNFDLWGRPFKFVAELYYKKLENIIPYEIDNVRIRYYSNELATGFAQGIDLKLNGHFVRGLDSWFSLSVMQTEEDIIGDNFGYIPRPSDQILNVGLFFQDFFPANDSYKIQMTLLYGTPLPFGPPKQGRQNDVGRMPDYKRVDIGFSKDIRPKKAKGGFLNKFDRIWISAEIFNLLGINNTISYSWITVVPNEVNPNPYLPTLFGVPNRLTARRLNVRLTLRF